MGSIRKFTGGMVLALALAGCGGNASTTSQPAAPAAASNYQITCKVDGADVTVKDYHEIWTKGGSDDCLPGDGTPASEAVTEPFTADQIAAIDIARKGGSEVSGGDIVASGYSTCGETKAGAHFDPANPSNDWSTMPDAAWAMRVTDLQMLTKLCPDHPWAAQWASKIASRAVVEGSR